MPISVYRPNGLRVLQLLNGFKNPKPNDLAGRIALSREGIGPFHGLSGGSVAVPVDKQFGSAPEVYIAYDLHLAFGFFRGLA